MTPFQLVQKEVLTPKINKKKINQKVAKNSKVT
jgi:hypothetical protein